MIAVRLIVGVSEEAKARFVAHENRAAVRGFGRFRGSGVGDAVARQPVDRKLDAVPVAIARVIVRP
jgi:hypothetical protein